MEAAKATSLMSFAHASLHAFTQAIKISPIGMLHLERLEMTSVGVERGELLGTVPLAPKETTSVRQKEWAVTDQEFSSIVTDYLENYSERGMAEKSEMAPRRIADAAQSAAGCSAPRCRVVWLHLVLHEHHLQHRLVSRRERAREPQTGVGHHQQGLGPRPQERKLHRVAVDNRQRGRDHPDADEPERHRDHAGGLLLDDAQVASAPASVHPAHDLRHRDPRAGRTLRGPLSRSRSSKRRWRSPSRSRSRQATLRHSTTRRRRKRGGIQFAAAAVDHRPADRRAGARTRRSG